MATKIKLSKCLLKRGITRRIEKLSLKSMKKARVRKIKMMIKKELINNIKRLDVMMKKKNKIFVNRSMTRIIHVQKWPSKAKSRTRFQNLLFRNLVIRHLNIVRWNSYLLKVTSGLEEDILINFWLARYLMIFWKKVCVSTSRNSESNTSYNAISLILLKDIILGVVVP